VTAFVGILIAAVAVLGALAAARSDRDPRLVVAAGLGLVVAASTRNVLWIYVGFEAFSFAATRWSARTVLPSAIALAGVVTVALAAGATDLAAVEPAAAAHGGVLLLGVGLVIKWIQSRESPLLFLGAAVALAAVAIRISAWAPETADALAPLSFVAAMAAVLGGGIGAALSPSTRTLTLWLTVSTLGLAVLGLSGGAVALAHVLAHLGASTVMLALVMSGAPRAGTWLAMLSLASVPPLPGFVSKLGLLASLAPATLAIVTAALVLTAVGAVRELDRGPRAARPWVTLAALAAVVSLGVFPELFLTVARRAALFF
jgi:hypothetical protein